MLKPSLYALYKQGRFRRAGLEGTDAGIQQIERFAVAMLAFVLEHDVNFRRHFLERLCGPRHSSDAENLDIELEFRDIDLVLSKKDDSRGFAFEFKVGGDKQWNQIPRIRDSFHWDMARKSRNDGEHVASTF